MEWAIKQKMAKHEGHRFKEIVTLEIAKREQNTT